MNYTRRTFLQALSLGITSPLMSKLCFADPPLPNPSTFESGDLVWPKKAGSFVPYSESSLDRETEAQRWINERDTFINQLKEDPKYFTREQIHDLQSLNYNDFYVRYIDNRIPGEIVPYSANLGVSVGHVGIIEIDLNGNPWVVEALWGKGVVRTNYQQWLISRPDEIVWHGRIRGKSSDERSRFALEAKQHVDKPYDFWNFDLNDDIGFYCSKLVWLSVYRTLGFAIDGNSNSQRIFWFSPKQLLYADTIARLNNPGSYTNT